MQGREQVLGFHLPGEFIGLSAIHPASISDAIALDTVSSLAVLVSALLDVGGEDAARQQQMFR